MMHKKTNHIVNVKTCEKYLKNLCLKSTDDCWYEHPSSEPESEDSSPPKAWTNVANESVKEKVFHEALGNSFTPDQMKNLLMMVSNLCSKVEKMEKRFEDLME